MENEFRHGSLSFPEGLTLVPDLFCFKVTEKAGYRPLRSYDVRIRFPKQKDKYVRGLKRLIFQSLLWRAQTEIEHDKQEEAGKIKNTSVSIFS